MAAESLEELFPQLRIAGFRVTSPKSWAYNCVAWAAGIDTGRWWPSDDDRDFWPEGIDRVESLESFRLAFATMGYVECRETDLETGFEKIAIFTDAEESPLHLARQLSNGQWTSKLGALEDIEHDLHGLEGLAYGRVAVVMKRIIASSGQC